MARTGYLTGVYLDPETNRQRWAVVGPTNAWYFPKRYGKTAARRLCRRLNKAEH